MNPKPILTIRYYLLLAMLYLFIPAQAQKPAIGVKAGPVISNLSFRAIDPVEKTNKRISGMAGIFVHIPVKGRFSIRPAVEFVSKGANADNRFNNYSYDEKIQLSYLDFPVNFLLEFPLKKNKWFAGGGPVLSFLLNKDSYPGFKGNDLGVNIVAFYEWAIGASLALNFTQGLKNVFNNRNGGTIKNHYFGLTVGYRF